MTTEVIKEVGTIVPKCIFSKSINEVICKIIYGFWYGNNCLVIDTPSTFFNCLEKLTFSCMWSTSECRFLQSILHLFLKIWIYIGMNREFKYLDCYFLSEWWYEPAWDVNCEVTLIWLIAQIVLDVSVDVSEVLKRNEK